MSDGALIQIVDAALAEAARKAGPWLVCRPGCAECCTGAFEISSADARRLREGIAAIDPTVAARVRDRARAFPSDSDAQDETSCPALDPDTLTCDLYAWRPITCRTFGPPFRFGGESFAICELCFDGATPEQVADCAVDLDAAILACDSDMIVADALIAS